MLKKLPPFVYFLLIYVIFIPLSLITWLPSYVRTIMVLISAVIISWLSLTEYKKVREDKLKLLSLLVRIAGSFLIFATMLSEFILAPSAHAVSPILIFIPLILIFLSIVLGALRDIQLERRK